MQFRKLVSWFFTALVFGSIVFAQTPAGGDAAEKAKKKKDLEKELDAKVQQMLDQTIGDIGSLRLPGNRAVVFAMTGDIYWKFDSKRSRDLFRSSASEIINYNLEVEKEKLENAAQGPAVQLESFDPNDPRTEVLQLVSARDAELALELLAQTRSASLSEAMARVAQQLPKIDGTPNYDPERVRAAQEISLEQRLTMLASLSDPDRAAKAIKDQLAKGISTNLISLLNAVFQKDEKRSVDLGGDVVRKFVDTDFTKSNDEFNQGVAFLSYLTRQIVVNPNSKFRGFTFTDSQAREMANKLANTFLQTSAPPFVASGLSRAMSSLEKLLPEKAFQLKQKDVQNKKSAGTTAATKPGAGIGSGAAPRPTQSTARPFDPNDSPEEIIASAAKIADLRQRTSAYQFAATRISQIGDEARAKKVIDSIPDEKIRSSAMEQFEAMRVSRLLAAGNLDEARRLIGTLTNKKARIQRLVALATQFQRKGGEKDIEAATTIMSEAKTLVNPFPEDEDELVDLMELVRGYAAVDPDTAFRLVEPMISDFNDIVQATAVLSKYNKRDRSFKNGEMVMKVNGNFGGGMLPFRYVQQMQLLGRADLERMSILVDRFQRNDARTIMKLYVLQGYLRSFSAVPM